MNNSNKHVEVILEAAAFSIESAVVMGSFATLLEEAVAELLKHDKAAAKSIQERADALMDRSLAQCKPLHEAIAKMDRGEKPCSTH